VTRPSCERHATFARTSSTQQQLGSPATGEAVRVEHSNSGLNIACPAIGVCDISGTDQTQKSSSVDYLDDAFHDPITIRPRCQCCQAVKPHSQPERTSP